jgi:hypothetical protein
MESHGRLGLRRRGAGDAGYGAQDKGKMRVELKNEIINKIKYKY